MKTLDEVKEEIKKELENHSQTTKNSVEFDMIQQSFNISKGANILRKLKMYNVYLRETLFSD